MIPPALRGEGTAPDDVARLLPSAQAYLESLRHGVPAGTALAEAWHAFHAATDPTIRAMARAGRWPEADLHDGVQEVWVVLIRRLPDYRHDPARGRFRDWLFVVTRRTLLGMGRGRRDARPLGLIAVEDRAGGDGDPAALCERAEERRRVRRAFREFRARSGRVAFRVACLHWLGDVPAPRIAERLGLSVAQVWGHLQRSKRRLRPLLAAAAHAGPSRGRGAGPAGISAGSRRNSR